MKGWQTSREFWLSLASCGTMGEGYICKQNIYGWKEKSTQEVT